MLLIVSFYLLDEQRTTFFDPQDETILSFSSEWFFQIIMICWIFSQPTICSAWLPVSTSSGFLSSILCSRVHQFNFFGNIKNRQPAYASQGSLEDNFYFFLPQKLSSASPPKVWYFWKIPQSLLVIFSGFLFLRKGQKLTENTKKN